MNCDPVEILSSIAGALLFIYVASRIVAAVWFKRKHQFLKTLELEHQQEHQHQGE